MAERPADVGDDGRCPGEQRRPGRRGQGGDEHIDALAKKYLGLDTYPNRQEGEVRVIYRIEPERFTHMG